MALLAGNGLDILFFLLHRRDDRGQSLVINDRMDGVWGSEERIVIPPEVANDRLTAGFKFSGEAMDVWNEIGVLQFQRFDKARCDSVRFVRLNNDAHNRRNSLFYTLETLDSTLAHIEAHMLHRRLEALEARLNGETAAVAKGD